MTQVLRRGGEHVRGAPDSCIPGNHVQSSTHIGPEAADVKNPLFSKSGLFGV